MTDKLSLAIECSKWGLPVPYWEKTRHVHYHGMARRDPPDDPALIGNQ